MDKKTIITKLSNTKVHSYITRHGIKKLSLFGSFATGKQKPDSDVDLLYEQDVNVRLGRDFFDVVNFLQEQLGRDVDMVEKNHINFRIRDRILQEKIDIF